MLYIEVPDVFDVKSWKPYVKNSRCYLDHPCLEHGENHVSICTLDKFYPENIDAFIVATSGKELVTFHPEDSFIDRGYAIQLTDGGFHGMFIDRLKNNFHINRLEVPAYVVLWNILPKYYSEPTNEIGICLNHYKIEGITTDKLCEESRMHVPDTMKFRSKPGYKAQERWDKMEVKINKEIRECTESIFSGLSVRRCLFSIIACVVAVIPYFVLIDKLGIELTSRLCMLGAAPLAILGFAKYQDMNAEQVVIAAIRPFLLKQRQFMLQPVSIYRECLKDNIERHLKEDLKKNDKGLRTIKKAK